MQKRKRTMQPKTEEKEIVRLGDRLNGDILQQLKAKQKSLKEEEMQKLEEEAERKRQEKREREKNKSFEELFTESNLSWKDFK